MVGFVDLVSWLIVLCLFLSFCLYTWYDITPGYEFTGDLYLIWCCFVVGC